MAAPQLRVFVDFDSGTAFETNPLILDSATKGILGTNKLGSGVLPVEITDLVTKTTIRRGRSRITSKFDAGTADVVLYDQTGAWNPMNPASPYYPNLVPLRQIIIYATYLGVDYYIFSGFITNYDTGFRQGNEDVSTVTLRCVDGTKLLAGSAVTTVSGAPAGQLSGARVDAILDAVEWPISLRNVDTGDTTLQADPGTSRTALDALNTVADSEFGGVFVNVQGEVDFVSRNNLISSPATSVYTFSDTGSNISYTNAVVAFDDTTLINDVTVTRSGGTAQNAYDQTSIDTYFLHSGNRIGILVQTDTESLNQAKGILATRKDPEIRIDSIQLNLYDDTNPNKPLAGVDIELLDGITVTKTMPGATSITQPSLVNGIHHDITKSSWNTTLFTSEPLLAGFVLNSTVSGILGEDVLSY
ncbi:MAG: hypothetical protein EBR30_17190 [Cytophagia bacterium]|nr:hypothetical protein [Cytophagia bacterium]NBW36719.1 hypothetical protein [Cytophagia bacterium]